MSTTLRLDGGGETLLLGVREGRPRLDYWGPTLAAGETPDLRLLDCAVPHGMLDAGEAFDLFPQNGHGFTGRPALAFSRASGGFISQLVFREVVATPTGHILHLDDGLAGIAVELAVTLDPASGVAGFQSTLINTGEDDLSLDWISPAALPLIHDELLTFGGRWTREFATHRLRLENGLWMSESRIGRTSHHAPPFLVAGEPGFGDARGEALALHLAWSGDHRLFVERLRDGRLQFQAGEVFWPGEVVLAPGARHQTPWLYAARSETGLNGVSDRLHPFVRDQILDGRLRGKPRPIHFNTWEAVYFRHDLDELKALADSAKAIGAERFVLDDGWFRGRGDDTSSLGDWTPDAVKYPDGLRPLVDHVRGLGLQFGLWVEPEMANAESDLLRAHPDWVLGEPGREQPLGRGQYVLDLTRQEVSDNIFAQIDALLAAHPIAYLKWDMNRDLTHPASGGRPASHRQTRAVYALMDRLRAAHPNVEIESCSSGGARADYEVLRRTDRFWTSDCNDPLERQSIQQAFSIFFPAEVMGAHVGPAASHTTARHASLEFRSLTALFGHFGIEADVRRFPAEELAALASMLTLHKRLRPLLHFGRRVRLTPPDPGAVAFAVVGEAGAVVSIAQLETPRTAALGPLRLERLEPDQVYRVQRLATPARLTGMKHAPALTRGDIAKASGRVLRQVGLPLPILRAGEAAVFELTRVRP